MIKSFSKYTKLQTYYTQITNPYLQYSANTSNVMMSTWQNDETKECVQIKGERITRKDVIDAFNNN